MFRATMCPSSGENTAPMRRLVLGTVYRWLSGMQGGIYSSLHNRSHYIEWQMPCSHRYGIFSWWWAHSSPKHVEKSNKHIKKICAPSWFYLQKIIQGCTVNKTLKKKTYLNRETKNAWFPRKFWFPGRWTPCKNISAFLIVVGCFPAGSVVVLITVWRGIGTHTISWRRWLWLQVTDQDYFVTGSQKVQWYRLSGSLM